MASCYMINSNFYISAFPRPTITKLGRVVTLGEGLTPTKLHVPSIMWSYDVMWQNKNPVFPPP